MSARDLERRLRRLETARRTAGGEDVPTVVVYATEMVANDEGLKAVSGDLEAAITQARAARPRHRVVYALPDNHRGDGPPVWGARSERTAD